MKCSQSIMPLLLAALAIGVGFYAISLKPVNASSTILVSPMPGPSIFPQPQGITGNITIAYVRPVCTVTGQVPVAGPSLVVIPLGPTSTVAVLLVPLQWTLIHGCILFAPFHVGLQPGTYLVTLSSCSYLGCRHALPVRVNVQPGVYTQLAIKIYTGIV